MALKFRIDNVQLLTDEGPYEFDLSSPCTVFDGPVGTGKSSLLELIKFGLGGTAVLTPVVRSEVTAVHLTVTISGGTYVLRRQLGTRDSAFVALHDVGDDKAIEKLPIRLRPDGETSIGDRLLELLGFPKVRIPRARARATSANVPLTFNDVYAYIYVSQQGIDQSIVHHTEVFREPKRRAIFELMFGLLNERQLEIETRLGVLRDDSKNANDRRAVVGNFLDTADVRPRLELEQQLSELDQQAGTATEALNQLSNDIATLTNAHYSLRERVASAEAMARAAQERAADAIREAKRRRELVAQIQLDAAREERRVIASQQLSPLEFVSCPRCMQDLDDSRLSVDSCMLCLQPMTPRQSASPTPLSDIDEQVTELETLLLSSDQFATESVSAADAAEQELASARASLDAVTAEAVAPRFQEISLMSAARAEALATKNSVLEFLKFWEELDALSIRVQRLDAEKAQAENDLALEKERLSGRSSRLGELSDLFAETVEYLNVPWAESANIDGTNYLPLVNGEKFDTLAVAGGTKTMVTVAYHLTLLSYTLSEPESLLPGLLILDTPRKNLGFNNDDSRMGDQIYARIRTLVSTYGASVQFIIADNDVPQDRTWFRRFHFDYGSPLIRHVLHPGEEAIRTGEIKTVEGLVGD
jgi:hypothetical protein